MSAGRPVAEIGARIQALLEAAQEVARGAEAVPALVGSTGLSVEGVRLALAHSLERDVSPTELETLVARVRPAEAVSVVLAANVFTASVRALALAVASAPRVFVRPSRRDPWFSSELVRTLEDPRVVLVDEVRTHEGVVHAYGRDATMRALAERTRMPVWAHGAGLGVALVDTDADVREAAERIADDVVPFDQRGCLSPRVVVVMGGPQRAEPFADALHAALVRRRHEVPLGVFSAEERAEIEAAARVALMCGDAVGDLGARVAVVGHDPARPLPILPPGRNVLVVAVDDLRAAGEVVSGLGRVVVGVAVSGSSLADLAPPWARVVPLGALQRPRLDGPVDLRDVWLGIRGG